MLNNRSHVSNPWDLNLRNNTSNSSSHSATFSDIHRNNGGQRDRQGQDGYVDEGEAGEGNERLEHSDNFQHIEVHLTSNQWNGAYMPVLTQPSGVTFTVLLWCHIESIRFRCSML